MSLDESRNDLIANEYQVASRVRRDIVVWKPRQTVLEAFTLPHPGWVGSDYCGGTVIIAKNPGGPKNELHRAVDDRDLDVALAAFPTAKDSASAFRLISNLYDKQNEIGMTVLLEEVLAGLGEKRNAVAYINPCPYRTMKKGGGLPEEGVNWTQSLVEVVGPLLMALEPDTVLFLNSIEGKVDKAMRNGLVLPPSVRWPPYFLFRDFRGDDRGLPEKGKRKLAAAALDNRERTKYRTER